MNNPRQFTAPDPWWFQPLVWLIVGTVFSGIIMLAIFGPGAP